MSEEGNIYGEKCPTPVGLHTTTSAVDGVTDFVHVVRCPRPTVRIATESLQMDQAMVTMSIVQLAHRDPLRGLYVRASLRCPITKHV